MELRMLPNIQHVHCRDCYAFGVNSMKQFIVTSACLLVLLPIGGCKRPSFAPAQTPADAADAQALRETQREQLDLLPPPSKNRYMAVRSLDTWQNPYLTVQPAMVTIHVLRGDINADTTGAGSLLRPINARRQDLNVSPDKLADALSSIPADAWPYGRVVAVEEAHKTPAAGEPAVRRNLEATMKTLSDLGVVVYEWPAGETK
jgi:hypothetical protein